jgi:hypothetical protein
LELSVASTSFDFGGNPGGGGGGGGRTAEGCKTRFCKTKSKGNIKTLKVSDKQKFDTLKVFLW